MKIKLPCAFKPGLKIINRLNQSGYESYFVGGSVRDLFLERPINDVDVATSALPHTVMDLFEKVIPVGVEHGTVIVRMDQQSVEVTTFRRESAYTDHRRPDEVTFVSDVKQDLARRDFTMNALALNHEGILIDLYSGVKDIEDKLICAVGDPEHRFEEDALRMVRAIRFVSQLNFQIEEKTYLALVKLKSQLKHLAIERLAVEFEKIIQGEYYLKAIDYLLRAKITDELPLLRELNVALENLNIKEPFIDFSEFIAYAVIKEPIYLIGDWIQAWRLSNVLKRKAENLLKAYQMYNKDDVSNQLLYHLPEQLLSHFVNLIKRIDGVHLNKENLLKMQEQLIIKSRKDLKINGNDLITLFPDKKPGAWIEHYLKNLEHLVIEQKLENNKIKLKEWIKCNPLEIN